MSPNLPTGTVAFLFTDIQGSTQLWQKYPDAMPGALSQHHALLSRAIVSNDGYVFQIIGDAFCAAFHTVNDGLQAALSAQRFLCAATWGATGQLWVRMALHSGAAEVQVGEYTSGEYVSGLTLSRTARLLSAGHGGQILLSMAAHELVRDNLPKDVALRDLGLQRLKDLIRPEHVFQVVTTDLPAEFPPLKTLDTLPNNLPLQLTSFIGRKKEIDEIKELLKQGRLVTLTGAGGSGKTRLAQHVAADLTEEFSDGVWFVDLAPLSEALFVPQAMAVVLGLREEGGRPLMDLLVDFVRRRELLFVLDNCEHLVVACAQAVDKLLHAAPRLKIIVTSREGLGVAGEQIFSVPSLSIPETFHPLAPESLLQYEAVRLFIDRAKAVKNDFAVTDVNASAVAQICRRLDGIPLAIELAAARVLAMAPEQIIVRLDDRFRLLIGGSRTEKPRHQTLRAVVDWSWELLPENERALLRRLSVFAGGWTLDGAEMVGAGNGIETLDILDLLSRLASRSLVTWQERQGEPRYHMLETVRQYAHEKLVEVGEEAQLCQRHAEFYSQWVEQARTQVFSPSYAVWIKRLDIEQDNVHAALEWAVNFQPVTALRIANSLADCYWSLHSAYAETVHWYERALRSAFDAPLEVRAYALANNAEFALLLGIIKSQDIDESVRLARQSGDPNLLATVLTTQGVIRLASMDAQGAATCFEEALPLAQTPPIKSWILSNIGDLHVSAGDFEQAESYFQRSVNQSRIAYSWGQITRGLWNLGYLALLRGDFKKARSDLVDGLRLARELNRRTSIAHIIETMGIIDIHDGAFDEARSLLNQALSMLQELGMRSCLAHNLEGWARLASAQGDPRRAVHLLSSSIVHLNRLGMSQIPLQKARYDQTLAMVQQQFDFATFRAEWAIGEKLEVEQAIDLALTEIEL